MNIEEYNKIKKQIANSVTDYNVIQKHLYKIECYINDHATIDIFVNSNNKAYFKKFMKDIKQVYKDFIEYVSFSKSDGYGDNIITIKLKDDKCICESAPKEIN